MPRYGPTSIKLFGEIHKSFWNQICHCAKSRKLKMTITPEIIYKKFLEQNCECDYCGAKLRLPKKAKEAVEPDIASLDRIDSDIGYIAENVHWVCKDCQWMKSNLLESEFILKCGKIFCHSCLKGKYEKVPA